MRASFLIGGVMMVGQTFSFGLLKTELPMQKSNNYLGPFQQKHRAAVSAVGQSSVVKDDERAGNTAATTNRKRNRRQKLPPGRPTLRFLSPFFDDTLQLLNPKTMASYQNKRRRQFDSPVFKTNIFFSPTVVVASSNALKEVVSQETDKTMEACFPPHHRKLFGEHSVLVTSGKDHARIRKLIQPSIASPGTVQSFAEVIDQSIANFLQQLEKECKELYYDDNNKNENFIEIVPRLRSYLVSLMLQLLLGPHYDELDDDTGASYSSSSSLADDVAIWSRGLLAPPLTMIPWSTAAKAMRARARIVQVLQRCIIKERRKNINDVSTIVSAKQQSYLLSRLVHYSSTEEDGSTLSLSGDEIIDNIFTLIFAGSDTTASAVSSLWMVLTRHPKLQEQLRESSQDITKDQLVPALLKAYPPAPFAMRLCKSTVKVDGYHIPPNWLVVYGLAGAMQQEQEPPIDWDSWLFSQTQASLLLVSANKSTSSSASLLTSNWAFGGGPRLCPGRFLAVLEISTFCKQLLSYTWELDPNQNLEQRYTPGFFPIDGLRMRHFQKK